MRSFLSRIEAKVKWTSLASLGASLLLALLNAFAADSQLLPDTPAWLQFVLVTFGPTIAVAAAGYKARHTAVAPVLAAVPPPTRLVTPEDIQPGPKHSTP
jgi:hypothetical protein